MMRCLGIVLLLCGQALSAWAAELQPLPAEVVQTWEKAGAKAGWVGPHRWYGDLLFSDQLNVLEAERAVPAFRFARWESGQIGKLPAPEKPFGLSFENTSLTDAGLKELAGLENLTSLDLRHTKVTDAGLKELAGLKNLILLVLEETKVTGAGVKELQKALPNCRIQR
jgi:hypothetical protein